MDFDFLTYPFEVLLAVFVMSSRRHMRIGWLPKIKAAVLCALVLAVYFSFELLPAEVYTHPERYGGIYFPLASIMYIIFAVSLAYIVWQLFDTSGIEALIIMAMGYGVQHSSYALTKAMLIPFSNLASPAMMAGVRLGLVGIYYIVIALWLVPRFHIRVEAVQHSMRWVSLSLFVLVSSIVFNLVLLLDKSIYVIVPSMEFTFRILDFLCTILGISVLLLVSTRDRLISDLDILTQLNEEKMKHYELSRENMELVNAKFHDVRKSLASIRATIQDLDGVEGVDLPEESMRELENAIRIYDSIYETGNDLIDAILTEKSLYSSAHGITFNAMADGEAFSFLEPAEISALFANIIDNAIEAVEQVDVPQQNKIIEFNAHLSQGYAIIESSNFYNGELNISPNNGLPVTSKRDKRFHGYGMRSIAAVVHEHNGTIKINANAQDKIFEIRVVIPLMLSITAGKSSEHR
ncbi:ATP-binding protein [Alloscardovia criceti]|uniref:ATP-binding protein n=1 Tax=Alloscardovia criceti TaxID=356828 RepID=UPI00037C0C8B|nr:GHKL domain-containing protein [Alloscardovia criceti]